MDDDAGIADATVLLNRVSEGDAEAADRLFPIVYAELRARAASQFRAQPADHTLQPTALVHEVYLKMIRSSAMTYNSRAHFVAVASTAMRQILVDHARRRAKDDRAEDGHAARPTLIGSADESGTVDLLELEDALSKLARLDERRARIVELRTFGGLSNAEVGEILGISVPTVIRQWRQIRAWLAKELAE